MFETFIKKVQGRQYDLKTGKISIETVQRTKRRREVQCNGCKAQLLNLQTFQPCGPNLCQPDRKGRKRIKSYKHLLTEVSISHII